MKRISEDKAADLARDIRTLLKVHAEAMGRIEEMLDKPSVPIAEAVAELAAMSRGFAANCHDVKFRYDWSIPPAPEWFDHFIDSYLLLRRDRNTFWMERGVYGVLALSRGGRVLELCCGDGYYTRNFYAPFAGSIVALDFDPDAIAHARRYNAAPNVEFRNADIRKDIPKETFDNVVWDAAIEHFTPDEMDGILKTVSSCLDGKGCLSGYTIVAMDSGKHLDQHEHEFTSMSELVDCLFTHFRNVKVFETVHPARHNLYFYASDTVLPFDGHWPHVVEKRR
ncbi:methyltransferase family protein [Azospirillum baldaniorum]|uniref:class I SAM-dependent methyltransferase n=1 Tax=Azospirillum baldaniorum TaxID=1064539 RepID=UPI0011A7BB16|nr:class I SAM-dependent methyltransferase [Azospirillum baldaniorum]TWA53125.1 methyltransferase family protein [Azospirillum baldaniorum]